MNHITKEFQAAQSNVEEEEAGWFTLFDFKLQCKSLKQEQSCHKDQQMNQQKSRYPIDDASCITDLGSTVENG